MTKWAVVSNDGKTKFISAMTKTALYEKLYDLNIRPSSLSLILTESQWQNGLNKTGEYKDKGASLYVSRVKKLSFGKQKQYMSKRNHFIRG